VTISFLRSILLHRVRHPYSSYIFEYLGKSMEISCSVFGEISFRGAFHNEVHCKLI